jgi:hypothetical protein
MSRRRVMARGAAAGRIAPHDLAREDRQEAAKLSGIRPGAFARGVTLMPTLLALSFGPDIPLDRRSILIGRHPECDVLLDSLRVSRRHCIITMGRGDVVVRDLGSTNGTWINGGRIVSALLRPGDEISIAHVRYYLQEALSIGAAEAHRASRPDDAARPAGSSHVSE